jgi:hypothetical protein
MNASESESLVYKGINYDVGTNFGSMYTAQARVNTAQLDFDFHAITTRLHCNAIHLYGTDVVRLRECASIARRHELKVWIQPRLIDATPEATLAHLAETAAMAEGLRLTGGPITLDLGCELTVFMSGIIPGDSFADRINALPGSFNSFPRFNQELNRHLGEAVKIARARFNGPLTYSAAPWETVEWSDFDIIGLDHYLMDYNRDTYVDTLRAYRHYAKPIVITEFGCCSYEGAAEKGPAGYDIIDWSGPRPTLTGDHRRNEQVQADYLRKLLRIFKEERVDGYFVYTFSNPDQLHDADPRFDLDRAGFGIVKVLRGEANGRLEWEPKGAFHAVAQEYRIPD